MTNLSKTSDILYAVSEKRHGNLSFRWGEKDDVIQKRQTFLTEVGLKPAQCVAMRVQHENAIAAVAIKDRGKGMASEKEALFVDALLTKDTKLPLFLLTADCLPLSFFDPVGRAIGLAHIGRKTAELGLSAKVVAEMSKLYKSRPENILVIAGPCIQQMSYVLDKPSESIAMWGTFATQASSGGIAFDLEGFALEQVQRAGILEKNITPCGIDTASSQEYFSHYRSLRTGETEGRFATVLMLR